MFELTSPATIIARIDERTPDGDEDGSSNDRTNERNPFNARLACNRNMEYADDQEDGYQTRDNSANDSIRRTTARNQLANNANSRRNNQPDDQCSESDNHASYSFLNLAVHHSHIAYNTDQLPVTVHSIKTFPACSNTDCAVTASCS